MNEELYFVADAALVDRLGRELVGKQETALIELVKNAYDADATEVTVTIGRTSLVIEDNGTGMTRQELVDGFLRLASNLKVRESRSRRFQRQRAGRKGIGRFATQRLGDVLTLQTWTDPESVGLELSVDWKLFKPEMRLEDVPVRLVDIPPRTAGTVLRIEGLRDQWSEAQIRRCWRGVANLLQPFPVAPVAMRPTADPGFAVRFLSGGDGFFDPEIVADLQTEILDHLHALIEFRVNEVGEAEWRLAQNRFGPDRNWTRIHHKHLEERNPPAYSTLRNVGMKAYYFILDAKLLPSMIYTRVRDLLRVQGGIRLYRNGFRVVPYGGPGDDWLGLEETYAQRGVTLAPIRNLNFFGVVEVYDPEGIDFEENTSREGLIETAAFEDLKELASSIILTAVRNIAEDRGRKSRAGGARAEPDASALEKIREAERRAREAAEARAAQRRQESEEEDKNEGDQGAPTEAEVAALLKEGGDIIAAREADLADETAILRLLATLGLTAAEFSHETGMTFEAVRISFRRVFDVARDAQPDDTEFQEDVSRAYSMLNRLDALTSYLNTVASARAVRELGPVSASREIERFSRGMKQQAEKQEIELKLNVPALDALYTRPMHEADVATILLNFYSNSVKAMRRTSRTRQILVQAERNLDDEIVIRFSDTGDGVPPENREKVFDLFFTTRAAAPSSADPNEQITGTGLGLWIVHQIVSKAGGDVELVTPPTGFATCFEVRLPAEEDDA
ncbi:sensor histidine kinase [Inquilinus sp. OTU3971]|uniref:sensor histidine kinase n=1 Tax=Inquilinus sp. OTU3971 TaxID=3043855 RepID=UPI00313B36EB